MWSQSARNIGVANGMLLLPSCYNSKCFSVKLKCRRQSDSYALCSLSRYNKHHLQRRIAHRNPAFWARQFCHFKATMPSYHESVAIAQTIFYVPVIPTTIYIVAKNWSIGPRISRMSWLTLAVLSLSKLESDAKSRSLNAC